MGIPPQVDGILGMTQGKDPSQDVYFPDDFYIGPLWIDELSAAGWITEKTFSTHFEGFDGSSYIDYGPVDFRSMSSLDEYVEIPC